MAIERLRGEIWQCFSQEPATQLRIEDLDLSQTKRVERVVARVFGNIVSVVFAEPLRLNLLSQVALIPLESRIETLKRSFGIQNGESGAGFAFQIAKFFAQLNGDVTARNFQNLDIQDQVARIEIAKLCAEQNGIGTAQNIQNFGIKDPSALFDVGIHCFTHIPGAFRNKLLGQETDFIEFPPEYLERQTYAYNKVLDPEFIRTIPCELGDAWNFISDYADMDSNKEIVRSLFFSCIMTNKMDVLASDSIRELVHALLDFRVPFLKPYLFDVLVKIITDDKSRDFDAFIHSFQIPEKYQKKRLTQVFMLAVFSEVDDALLKHHLVDKFLENMRKRDTFLPIASKTGALIEFLHVVSGKHKERMEQICSEFIIYTEGSVQFSQNLFLAQAAIGLGIDISNMKADQVRAEVCQQMQFPEGFAEIFETFRCRENLFMFFRRIQQLAEDERAQILKTWSTHLLEVTDGSFYKQRYDQSPHLKKMGEEYGSVAGVEKWSAILDKWKIGQKQKIEDFFVSHDKLLAERPFDWKTAFRNAISRGYVQTDDMPLTNAVVDGREVGDTIDMIVKNREGFSQMEVFDALCALLAQQNRVDPQQVREARALAPIRCPIRNSFQYVLHEFAPSAADFTGYTVENTDDHWDLFLSTTEVPTCLSIESPGSAKYLLGYVVDGKNRMIAIKDGKGRMVARSIIKLLWDGAQKKPVLIMETVFPYPYGGRIFNEIVEQMAKEEAVRLGVEFVSIPTLLSEMWKNGEAKKEAARLGVEFIPPPALGPLLQSYTNRSGLEFEDGGEYVQRLAI